MVSYEPRQQTKTQLRILGRIGQNGEVDTIKLGAGDGPLTAEERSMQDLLEGLGRLLFHFEVIRPEQNSAAGAIFAIGCSVIGVLTVVADLSFFAIRGESLLNLRHGWKNTLIFAFAWGVGALIIGYLGQIMSVFQVSLFACATVGISWPILFAQILERSSKQEVNQEPSAAE